MNANAALNPSLCCPMLPDGLELDGPFDEDHPGDPAKQRAA